MKIYFTSFCFSIFLFFGLALNSSANNAVSGDMIIIQLDKNLCDGKDSIRAVARFVRECDAMAPPEPIDIPFRFAPKCTSLTVKTAVAPKFSGTIMGQTFTSSQLPKDPCINTNKPCAQEVYHYATPIIVLDPCQWTITWARGDRPIPFIPNNLVAPQTHDLAIRNNYDNSRPCKNENTGPQGTPPNTDCIFDRENNSALFLEKVPVLSFCVNKKYDYQFKATDPDGDLLRFKLVAAIGDMGLPINYMPGLNYLNPFPSKNGIEFDSLTGIMSFTPTQDYEANVGIQIMEYRDSCWIDANTNFLNSKKVLVGTTMRDVRFVFDDNCVKETVEFRNFPPDPEDDDPTPPLAQVQNGVLFVDCNSRYIPIELTHAIQCSSIEPNGTDFRFVSGDVNNPSKLFAIDAAYPIDFGPLPYKTVDQTPYYCNFDTTRNIMIKMYRPLSPGNYKLFIKMGDDKNTIKTKCGIDLDEYTSIDVIVNNKPKKVKFDIENIKACRPENPAPIATIKNPPDIPNNAPTNEYFFGWNYSGTYQLEDSTQSMEVDSAGTWYATVDFNGCTYTDTFEVEIYGNIPLPEIPNYDLCFTDTFPLIDTMKYFLQAMRDSGKVVSGTEWWLYTNKNPNGEIVGYLDTLKTVTPGRYEFRAIVDLCELVEEFTIYRRTPLIVEIGEDTMLCQGNSVTFISEFDFKSKSIHYDYEWFLDRELIPGEDQRELPPVSKSGEYILRVSKPSGCFETDTVDVLIVDTLNKPQPECVHISFDDDIVEVFAWPFDPDAESYEISEDDGNSWIPAVEGDSINSHISNSRSDIWVRAVNEEVKEGSECKYSLPNYAERCPVEVVAPNIFTPNGDGVNDYLMFNLIELFEGSSLKVFNRWGKKIYESDDYRNDWDGDDNESGTYFYLLNINDDRYEDQQGTFTLLR